MQDAILNILLKAKDEASAVLKNASGTVDSTKKGVEGLGKSFMVAGGMMTAGGLAGVAMIKDWVSASVEAQADMAKFDAKLKASFGTAPDVMAKVKQSAEQTSQAFVRLGFDDETTANSFLTLAAKTKDAGKATELMGLASDMARAKGIGLSDATEQISKILMGKGNRALVDYGIVAKKGGTATEYLAEIQKKVAGQAEAYAGTTVGATEAMNETFKNMKETLGAQFLPILTKVMTQIVAFVGKLQALNPNILPMIAMVVGIGTAFSLIVGPILFLIGMLPALSAGFAILSGTLLPALGIIAAVVAVALAVWWAFQNWTQIVTFVQGVWVAIQAFVANMLLSIQTFFANFWLAIQTFFTPIINFIIAYLTLLWTFWSFIFNTIYTLVSFIFQGIWAVIQIVMAYIQAGIETALNAIWAIFGGTLTAIWNTVTTVFNTIWTTISTIMTTVFNFVKSILNSIWSAFVSAFNSVSNTVKTVFQEVYDWFSDKLTAFWNKVTEITGKVKQAFQTMADGIMSALRTIKFPHLSIGSGTVNVAGKEIQYPKLDVAWYKNGGWVGDTGLAVVHEGEYVLSKDMLAGRTQAAVGSNSYSQPITIYANINTEVDLDMLAYKLAYVMRNR